jgi:hypothetical protein
VGGWRRGAQGQSCCTAVVVSINEKGAAVLLWLLVVFGDYSKAETNRRLKSAHRLQTDDVF